ncbi:protein kinase [Phyllosticta capitalensis]
MNAQKAVGWITQRLLYRQTTILRTSRRFSFGATRSKPITEYPYLEVLTDSESANRYGAGGFFPIHLGDQFKGGRYKILHKLSWGSDSTVWAARDQREGKYVAIKVLGSDRQEPRWQLDIMRAIAVQLPKHPGSRNLVRMLDQFCVRGHDFLVLELLGQNVQDYVTWCVVDERLPGKKAKRIAKETLLGLDYLHTQGITHGDLHTRNLAFTIPCLDHLSEEDFCKELGDIRRAEFKRRDGGPLEPGLPKYLVGSAFFPKYSYPLSPSTNIKIVDFGQAFLSKSPPATVCTPLVLRPPEVVFGDPIDYRVDLWSMGCLLFELITGQPPFDNVFFTPTSHVRDMVGTLAGEQLPHRWQQKWLALDRAKPPEEPSGYTLQTWLEEAYFDEEKEQDLSRRDIRKVGELVQRMLRFEPTARATAAEILKDPWFEDV